jgi:hypothetical protein
VLALSRLLGGVVADDVASATFAVADDHRLDPQTVTHLVVAPLAGQHLVGDLVAGAHLRAEDVLAAAEGERAPVGLGGHAGIADEERSDPSFQSAFIRSAT